MTLPDFKLIPTPVIPLEGEGQRPLLCRLILPADLPPGAAGISVSDGTLPMWTEQFLLNSEEQRISLEIPAWMTEQPVSLMLSVLRNNRIRALVRAEIRHNKGPRPTAHLLHSTHSIYPAAESSAATVNRRMETIHRVLDLVEKDPDSPEAARFKWTVDVSAPVIEFLRTRGERDIERLKQAVERGQVDVSPMLFHPRRELGWFGWSKVFDEMAFLSENLFSSFRSVFWISETIPEETESGMLADMGVETILHLRPTRKPLRYHQFPNGIFRRRLGNDQYIDVITGAACFNGNLAGIPGDTVQVTDALMDLWIDQCSGRRRSRNFLVHLGSTPHPNGGPSSHFARMIPELERKIGGLTFTTATLQSYVDAVRAENPDPPSLESVLDILRSSSPEGESIDEVRGAKKYLAVMPGIELLAQSVKAGDSAHISAQVFEYAAVEKIADIPAPAARLKKSSVDFLKAAAELAASAWPSSKHVDIWTFNTAGCERRDIVRVKFSAGMREKMPDNPAVAPVDEKGREAGEPSQAQWETVTGRPVLVFAADFGPWQQRLWRVKEWKGKTPSPEKELFKDTDGKFITPFYEVDISEPARGLSALTHIPRNRLLTKSKSGLQLGEPFLVLPPGLMRGATARLGKRDTAIGVIPIQRGSTSMWRIIDHGPIQAVLNLDVAITSRASGKVSGVVGTLVMRLFAEFDRVELELLIRRSYQTGDGILYWALPMYSSAAEADTVVIGENGTPPAGGFPYWVTGPDYAKPLGTDNGYTETTPLSPGSVLLYRRNADDVDIAVAAGEFPLMFPNAPTQQKDGSVHTKRRGKPSPQDRREYALQVPLYAFLGTLSTFTSPPDPPMRVNLSFTGDVRDSAADPGKLVRFGHLAAAPVIGRVTNTAPDWKLEDAERMKSSFLDYPPLVLDGKGKDLLIPVWMKPRRNDGWQLAVYNPTGDRLKVKIGVEDSRITWAEEVNPLGMTLDNLNIEEDSAMITVPPRSVKCMFFSCD